MKRALLIFAALMLGCSAGSGQPAVPAGPAPILTDVSKLSAGEKSEHFSLRMLAGKGIDVLVGARDLTSTELSVTRYTDADDHSIRGTAFDRTVDINITADGAKGLLGPGPLDIKVALVGDELQIHGSVAGETSALSFNPREITGNVGRCMFQMARRGAEYTGARGCGRSKEEAQIIFPASFGAWSVPEMGAALAILLTSGM
jgi:hypothetical protein